jgi:hypothetical protein
MRQMLRILKLPLRGLRNTLTALCFRQREFTAALGRFTVIRGNHFGDMPSKDNGTRFADFCPLTFGARIEKCTGQDVDKIGEFARLDAVPLHDSAN